PASSISNRLLIEKIWHAAHGPGRRTASVGTISLMRTSPRTASDSAVNATDLFNEKSQEYSQRSQLRHAASLATISPMLPFEATEHGTALSVFGYINRSVRKLFCGIVPTHCKHGHSLDNAYIFQGKRLCRE